MASIVETKAVALRRGNTSENMAFTGVQGEVTVDLGNDNLGTDVNATLRLHNGITKGGIPMARADMLNVSAELLAENRQNINDRNLAYADLTNIEVTTNDAHQKKIVSTLSSYGIAIDSQIQALEENKANVTMSNVHTEVLATGENQVGKHLGKNLAYADGSNVINAGLADPNLHTDPLAYANLSNVDTTYLTYDTDARTGLSVVGPSIANADGTNIITEGLASQIRETEGYKYGKPLLYYDLSNVDEDSLNTVLQTGDLNVEHTTSKDEVINRQTVINGHYPSTNAVINYIDSEVDTLSANNCLTNIEDWNALFYGTDDEILHYYGEVYLNETTGFVKDSVFKTDILLKDDPKGDFYVIVKETDDSGKIELLEITHKFGSRNLSGSFYITSDTNSTAEFTVTSTLKSTGVYEYAIDQIINASSGFEDNKEYKVSNEDGNVVNIVYREVDIIITDVSDGKVTGVELSPKYGLTSLMATQSEGTIVTIDTVQSSYTKIELRSEIYNENGGAGVVKVDFSNLLGMNDTDKSNEIDSPWRIRHNEPFPSFDLTQLPENQKYTIATNANLWEILKPIYNSVYNSPSVSFTAKFVPNSSHQTSTSQVSLIDTTNQNLTVTKYGENSSSNITNYRLLPNTNYILALTTGGSTENYGVTTGEPGTVQIFNYSLAQITFNLNVQTATLVIERITDGNSRTIQIQNGTATCSITSDSNWQIFKEGYTSVFGTSLIENGNQTLTISLDEESY